MNDLTDGTENYFSEVFHHVKLDGKTLTSISFEDCSFENCDFSGSRFVACEFNGCSFVNCNLSVVKVDQSRFEDVTFEACKASGIDWTRAHWQKPALYSPVKFFKSIISHSTFWGLHLEDMVINDCTAHDVDFRDGRFCQADFRSTDFKDSLFKKTDLTGADLTGAVNYRIDLNHNKIKKAKFSRYEAISLLYSLDIELVD